MSPSLFAAGRALEDSALRKILLEEMLVRRADGRFGLEKHNLNDDVVSEKIQRFLRGHKGLLNITSDWPVVMEKFEVPVLPINGGAFTSPSSTWSIFFTNLPVEVKQKLESAIANVGRVQQIGSDLTPYVGTAWFVRENLMVTNAHVAEAFAYFYSPYKFKNSGALAGIVDMKAERGQTAKDVMRVKAARFMQKGEDVDVAFMEMDLQGSTRAPLTLSSSIAQKGDLVAVIGYPTRDQDGTDQGMAQKIFGNEYDFKRISLGWIVSANDSFITHNCQTLRGNSGSPLISLTTGEVLGIHLGGDFLQMNVAMPVAKIKNALRIASL